MSSAMEFAITTDLTPLKEFNISANFEECQAWLEENLAPYRGMVVTEEATGPTSAPWPHASTSAGRWRRRRRWQATPPLRGSARH